MMPKSTRRRCRYCEDEDPHDVRLCRQVFLSVRREERARRWCCRNCGAELTGATHACNPQVLAWVRREMELRRQEYLMDAILLMVGRWSREAQRRAKT
jgi:ribosomal protein L37AE/L43A